MKKNILFIFTLFIPLIAFSDDSVSLNDLMFQNLQMPEINVKNALKLNVKTSVNLEGKVIKHLSDKKFLFTDNTADIIIIINDNILSQSQVPINKLIKINGDIVKQGHKNLIYLNKLEIIDHMKDNNNYFIEDSNLQLINVKQAKKYLNGSVVMLSGQIIQDKGNSEYLFKDKTGKINIKISDNITNFKNVPLNRKVKIIGLINKSMFKFIKINIEKIELLE